LIHAAEITVGESFYSWQGCLPDAESGWCFCGVTYATMECGEVVLSKPWRTLGPVEGLTGILRCGLSAGFFLAIVNRIHATRLQP